MLLPYLGEARARAWARLLGAERPRLLAGGDRELTWSSSRSQSRSSRGNFGRPSLYLPTTPPRALRRTPILARLRRAPAGQRLRARRATTEEEREERKKRVVVIVDEAHLLSAEQLEELRLLTNSEMDSVRPFAGILLGQPQLRRRLRMGSFAALDQRIALRYELAGMDGAESADYLAHHLKLAGREDRLFSDDAVALLHERSRGIPRALNNLATQALIATFAAEKSIVDESAAQAAVAEVMGE